MSNGAPDVRRFGNPEVPGESREEAAMPYDPAGAGAGTSRLDAVRDRHAARLMAVDGVVGVASGRTPIGDEAIVLYLRDASVKRRVPAEIEGFPVEAIVTGEIDARRRRP